MESMTANRPLDDRGSSRLIAKVRIRDMERLIVSRHGGKLPNDADGLMIIKLVAHHAATVSEDAAKWVSRWCGEWAPWVLHHDNKHQLLRLAAADPINLTADELAERLSVTKDERDALGITTIGAIDCDREQRAELRRERKRTRAEGVRRSNGAIPRDQYEAESLSRTKPWEKMGMSRSTWYRAGKPRAA